MLENNKCYSELPNDPYKKTQKNFTKLINEQSYELTDREQCNLANNERKIK